MDLTSFRAITSEALLHLADHVPPDIMQPVVTEMTIPSCRYCAGREFFFRPSGRALCVDCDSLRQAAGIEGFVADLRGVVAHWQVQLALPGAKKDGRLDVWLWADPRAFLRHNHAPYLDLDKPALVISAATSKGRAVLQSRPLALEPPVADALQLMSVEEAFVAGAPLVRPRGMSVFVRSDTGEDLVFHTRGKPMPFVTPDGDDA